ncbi:hypothetical protein KPL70_019842 [Citrus sinensis]|nr:hypothetical protein KPL70_019842 [Citrus sinensis]
MQVFLLSFWQVQAKNLLNFFMSMTQLQSFFQQHLTLPNVPADTLQEAMDYACGEGGADCEEIMPHGNCFYPDTVVAHASYAFNSYWQKTKRNGGTCAFGGTAMLINADPSLLRRCAFKLALLVNCRLSYGHDA